MKVLINKANPAIRITAPKIIETSLYYVLDFTNDDNTSETDLFKDEWTLVEEEPAEDWKEKRKKECPFRRNLDNNLYGCERYADVVYACDGKCSWVVDYPKLKEIQDKKEQEQAEVNFKVKERKWVHDAVDNVFPEDGDFMSEFDFRKIIKDTARHFYELGKGGSK